MPYKRTTTTRGGSRTTRTSSTPNGGGGTTHTNTHSFGQAGSRVTKTTNMKTGKSTMYSTRSLNGLITRKRLDAGCSNPIKKHKPSKFKLYKTPRSRSKPMSFGVKIFWLIFGVIIVLSALV